MLVGFSKKDINIPRSNSLDYRKCISKDFINNLLIKL